MPAHPHPVHPQASLEGRLPGFICWSIRALEGNFQPGRRLVWRESSIPTLYLQWLALCLSQCRCSHVSLHCHQQPGAIQVVAGSPDAVGTGATLALLNVRELERVHRNHFSADSSGALDPGLSGAPPPSPTLRRALWEWQHCSPMPQMRLCTEGPGPGQGASELGS